MSDAHDHPSRRRLLGAAAVIGASAATGRARAQEAAPAAAAGPGLIDPREAYPAPPYEEQSQDFPGLAREMSPPPDHGERSYRGSGRLTGRKALITGGDSGMGRAAAIAYAREGADVAISYLPAEEPDARDVVRYIEEAGRKAVRLPGDIRSEEHCTSMVQRAAEELGGLDILVNNASRQQTKPAIGDITTEAFDATMKTNIYAMFWITKAAVPLMRPGAVIIQTTSEQATNPSEDLVDYAMTKAAMTNFTRSMAKQLGPKGIRVNAVAPGPIWTPLQVSGGATMEKLVQFGGETPMGRAGQPAELASIYVQLADPLASFATGQVYASTGGGGQA